MESSRGRHWDEAYETAGAEGPSWFQADPSVSLALIRSLRVPPGAAVVDVGGGASLLVDRLLGAGFTDVSVLDVSEAALRIGRRRVGDTPSVTWLHRDVLAWQPDRRYGLWHDRATFHFLTDADDRVVYLETMRSAIEPGGGLVIATFADDGPEYCSGLPVARYSVEELVAVLGDGFTLSGSRRERHATPGGVVQPFSWVAGTVRR